MSERIYKLQPNRTIALRGFDDLGASAAIHSATSSSFTVSGTFRDTADFAVLNLYDADNFYEHPRLKYLPDFRFDGLTLTFDVHYSNLMPLDSPKFPTIDWPYLSVIRADGSSARIRLSDHASVVSGANAAASATFTITANGVLAYDRVTLWYGNLAFDYIAASDGVTANAAAQAIAAQINGVNWTVAGSLIPLSATADGADIRITAAVPGIDGNMLSIYAISKNDRLCTTKSTAVLSGGASDATWHVTLDFTTLGIPQIRLMWLTFAPPLANGSAFADVDWEAKFTNWTLSGPESTRTLQVAVPGTVRVEEDDTWCTWTGTWDLEQGFYSGGYARKAASQGCKVRVKYASNQLHDLYLGTALYSGAGSVGVTLDGVALASINCALGTDAPVNTRRLLKNSVPAGEHTVEFTAFSGFRFDFLEAAIPGDVPDALAANSRLSPALDYSTDHTYKLPPARIHWIFDQLGFTGPMNEYIGVFWWNQRKRINARFGQVQVTFTGTFVDGDAVFLTFGSDASALTYGKSVFPADTPATVAQHFAMLLNGASVGVWAQAVDNVLTITSRSPKLAYRIAFAAKVVSAAGSAGAVSTSGNLNDGAFGTWVVDPAQSPALNRGALEWHADMFRECAVRNRQIVLSESMELVNPPDGFAAMFPDGKPVQTDVGFGSLSSTHCNFGSGMRRYQIAVLSCVAGLMSQAGIASPEIQFGEFLWWFFTNQQGTNGGMAYYDDETKSAAQAALGRPLAVFRTPDDDPMTINNGADAIFLRSRLNEHVAAVMAGVRATCPSAVFEVLFPYDVNYPTPAGIHSLGGKLNSFVNLPIEWQKKETAGFDRLKTEALDFGAWCRDLNLSSEAIRLPAVLGWPRDAVRHLVPIFQPGYAWQKELSVAYTECPVVNLWAWDHICLLNVPVAPNAQGRSALMAA